MDVDAREWNAVLLAWTCEWHPVLSGRNSDWPNVTVATTKAATVCIVL